MTKIYKRPFKETITLKLVFEMFIVLLLMWFICKDFIFSGLLLVADMPVFEALNTAFATAGTGGFGFIPGSMEMFNPFSQYVMASFLILFGCNFSLYYLIIVGRIKEAWKSEELKNYLAIAGVSVLLIFASLVGKFEAFPQSYTVEEAFRHSFFQVASIMTTAGFSTTDYALWPTLAVTILVVVMFVGGMAGSTAGGMKVSRIIIAVKGAFGNVRSLINPRYVPRSKFEGKLLERKTINDVFAFVTLNFFILMGTVFVLALDPLNGQIAAIVSDAGTYSVEHGFFSNFSSALACLSNVGPAFEAVGPYSSYAGYSAISKILLTFVMLVGRLEILPVLVLFSPKTWKKI